jgi:7,8-dihydro-6-hydroxymethylpterin-pyrophosphokinase
MLGPMAEIAPEVVHPTANKTIGQLWEEFDRDGHAMNPVALPEMVPGTVI